MNTRGPRRLALVLALAGTWAGASASTGSPVPRASLVSLPVFDPGPAKAWIPAFKGFSDWSQTESAAGLLGGDPSWGLLGLLNLDDPARLAVLTPLARQLATMSPDGGRELRARMSRMRELPEGQRNGILESLQAARLAAADEVVLAADELMDRHVRHRKLLRSADAARDRIVEVESVLLPLSHLTFYDAGELSIRYNEALIKLESLKRAVAKLEAETEAPRVARVRRMAAEDLRDAPAEPSPYRDPYVAARQLQAELRSRGIESPKVMVIAGPRAHLTVAFDSPEDRDKALDLFTPGRGGAPLTYRRLPVKVLLPR